MKQKKTPKKKKGSALFILTPISLLMVAALVILGAVYFGGDGEPISLTPAPAADVLREEPVPEPSAEPEQTPAPYRPPVLHLDVYSTGGNLDVAVCDGEGTVVPGYGFPLEIYYEDGTSHSVRTDTTGHYYADYLLSGSYIISMPAIDGFVRPDSVRCRVDARQDYRVAPKAGEIVTVNASAEPDGGESPAEDASDTGIDPSWFGVPTVDVRYYRYRYNTDEAGFLLYADGTSSDVMPVEEDGILACGLRSRREFFSVDGKPLEPSEIPEDAAEGLDYYSVEKNERVELILREGVPDSAYDIVAEERHKTVTRASLNRIGWQERNGKTYYIRPNGVPVTGLWNIDGRLYYFDDSGARASSLGIDVSYFNSSIDWEAVKAAGVDFVIVRVAFRTWEKGLLKEDEDSYRQGKDGGFYLQGAKEAGLKVGAYVYSTAKNEKEAVEEASFAINIVRKSGVELDMPIYIDYEFSGDYPKGRADKMSLEQRAKNVKAFCEKVGKEGYAAGVSSNEAFVYKALRLEDVADYDVWYAVYTEGFVEPDHRRFHIWQFSESIGINGMPDLTDMNVIF